jgi:hypothetical protein
MTLMDVGITSSTAHAAGRLRNSTHERHDERLSLGIESLVPQLRPERIEVTKKEALIDKILTRIITECPFPPSDYVIETTRAILREELPAPVLR